jgi:DNA polymerase-1
MESAKVQARQLGYVTTLFGRRCHMPGVKSANPTERAGAERAAINAPLQGAAADIIKRAMVAVAPALAEARLKTRMLLQVHDELVFEAPQGEAAAATRLVRKCMEGAAHLSVPLVVEIGEAANWEEAH